jgi:TonB family protein
MAGPGSPDSNPRKTQPAPDAHDRPSSDATALGRTLEAELTRAATRANPASLAPSPSGGAKELDLDSISASVPAGADALTPGGDAPAAEDPDAEDAQSSASQSQPRRPRIGWGGVLALLNVVLSGFILMLWGVPRWDGGRGATQPAAGGARGKSTGAAPAAGSAAGDARPTSTGAPSLAGGATGLNAASGPGRGTRRTNQRASDSQTDAAFDDDGAGADATGGVEVPELPQAIISVMPGQRAPELTVPPPPQKPDTRTADNAAGDGLVRAGADDAIEAGNAAARATGDSGAPRIPIAGADGVTMPERLAESHVRPTIAALADGEPVTGEVRLAATVRVDGSVADVQVLSSSRPGAGLEHAAADAVRRWRYKPATRDGQPIDSRLTITVTFR